MRSESPVSSAGLGAASDFVAGAVGRGGPARAVARRIPVVVDEVCADMIHNDDSLAEARRPSPEARTVGDPGGDPGMGETVPVISVPGRPFDPLEERSGPAPEIGGHGLAPIRSLSSARSERVDGLNRLTLPIPARG